MKRFFDWLSDKLFPKKTALHESLRRSGMHQIPTPPARKPVLSEPPRLEPEVQQNVGYSAETGGKIVDGGPGKNVLVRNKYVREDTGTHETLKIVDDSILDSDDEFGLDPYNTGRFDRSKPWDTSRK